MILFKYSNSGKAYILKSTMDEFADIPVKQIAEELIEEKGRLEVPGRPILYGTTARFLQCAGISDAEELRKAWAGKMTEGELF